MRCASTPGLCFSGRWRVEFAAVRRHVACTNDFGMSAVVETLWWILSAALVLLGLAGTVLPALPGTLFVWAGVVLGAWIDDFTRVGGGSIAAVSVLAVLAWGLDYASGLLGAKKAGASRQAIAGAALGTLAGLFMGLVGVLFMPLVGAALGEYLARRDGDRAVKVGVATWLGIMAGLVAKVVIAFMMIGIFVAALLI
jgi:uncharacterized protein